MAKKKAPATPATVKTAASADAGPSTRLELTRQSIRRILHDIAFVAWPDLPEATAEATEWLRIVDSGAPDAVAQIEKRLLALVGQWIKNPERLKAFPADRIADSYVFDIKEVKV